MIDLTPEMTELLQAVLSVVAVVFVVMASLNGLAHWIAHRFWGD